MSYIKCTTVYCTLVKLGGQKSVQGQVHRYLAKQLLNPIVESYGGEKELEQFIYIKDATSYKYMENNKPCL